MSESIINGSQGIDTSDATANNSQILSGATAYVNGVKVTGNMPNRGSWGTSISPGSSVTIPSGYHSGGGSVSASNASPTGPYCCLYQTFGTTYGTHFYTDYSYGGGLWVCATTKWMIKTEGSTKTIMLQFDTGVNNYKFDEYNPDNPRTYLPGKYVLDLQSGAVTGIIDRVEATGPSDYNYRVHKRNILKEFGPKMYSVSYDPIADHMTDNIAYIAMPYYVYN